MTRKENLRSQSQHPASLVAADHTAPKHPMEHLGHEADLCLIRSDLKSLAVNDYLW